MAVPTIAGPAKVRKGSVVTLTVRATPGMPLAVAFRRAGQTGLHGAPHRARRQSRRLHHLPRRRRRRVLTPPSAPASAASPDHAGPVAAALFEQPFEMPLAHAVEVIRQVAQWRGLPVLGVAVGYGDDDFEVLHNVT